MPHLLVRVASSVILAGLLPLGCADAPITSADLQPDGRLRTYAMDMAALATPTVAEARQAVQITAVLTTNATGALEDALAFPEAVGSVYLHLRADSLAGARPVLYRWSRADGSQSTEVRGVLSPTTTLELASSHRFPHHARGTWRVEVLDLSTGREQAPVVFTREFSIGAPR